VGINQSINFICSDMLLSSIILVLFQFCNCTKHTFTTKRDGRFFIGPIGQPYGFVKKGEYSLKVYDYSLKQRSFKPQKSSKSSDADNLMLYEGGFLLKRFHTESDFAKFAESIYENPSICSFEEFRDEEYLGDDILEIDDDVFKAIDNAERVYDVGEEGVFLSMRSLDKWRRNSDNLPIPSVSHNFKVNEEGLYVLMYQVCATKDLPPFTEVRTSFELDISMHNFDTFGYISYLTAGEMPLPGIFLYFSMSYLICLLCWTKYLQEAMSRMENRGKVHQIHHMMSLLLLCKTLSVFFESVRYHYIRTTGHAELWSFVYYGFSFLKGIMLFTVILLIGSGWSFIKPFLNHREKRIILFVLILQVIDNLAAWILTTETEGERPYEDWSALLHLVDIICCCSVLIPIVWQVNALEHTISLTNEQETQDINQHNQNSRTLQKLKLFRTFYILVVSYIYYTRVIVYLVATLLDFRHTWLRYFFNEIGTLAFYAIVGFKFRPESENPYMEIINKKHDDDIDMEMTPTTK